MKKFIIISTVMLTLLATPVAWAKHNHNGHQQNVKVTKVQPINRVIHKHHTHVIYKQAPVRYKQSNKHNHKNKSNRNQEINHNSFGGTIVGGVVGGAIGHKVSHNKKAGTIIGAVIGATVGYKLSQ